MISSGVEAFWHLWIVQWLLGQQLRTRLLSIYEVRPKKLINFWFAGLKTSCWILCFAVAIDWGFIYFPRNTVRISARFSWFGLLMFLNVCSASPRMREWKLFILSSSVSWLWIFKTVWNRSSNCSIFSDFPSKVGIVVVRDLGSFETLLPLLLTLAELLFVANCWGANKIWSASIVAGVFSLRNCG